MTEAEAISRLQSGDLSGLDTLVRKYQVQAIRAAYLITRDRASAEDIVQSAFLDSYERIHQFQVGRPFGPWFLRCVINSAIKSVNRQRRQSYLPDDEIAPQFLALVSEIESAESIEAKAAIWSALGALSAEQRSAIVLFYYLEMSEIEIAHELSCPPGTVKSRLHHARKRLRQLLNPLW